jgi:mono/diheme cytochrome c family protein
MSRKAWLRGGIAVALLILFGTLALAYIPLRHTPPQEILAADWRPAPGSGGYVAAASDCTACHTKAGGRPFAGGRAIESPFGKIWATNITPDPDTGIGRWSLDDFRAALYDGVAPDGRHLYPAMPYENYRKLSERDVRALYDFFMHDVAPVNQRSPKTSLSFPFDIRLGLRAWNWLALSGSAGPSAAAAPPLLARGRYLIEGPGHCAACHSPRTMLMTEAGTSADNASFLTGGLVDGWPAPPLRGSGSAPRTWSIADMARYLSTGRNSVSTANGAMGEVVEHSLQNLSDRDIVAIAAFLETLDGHRLSAMPSMRDVRRSGSLTPLSEGTHTATEQMLVSARNLSPGARLYTDNCAACHGNDGMGSAEIFPALAGNSLVTSTHSKGLIEIILQGASLPSTKSRPMRLRMQGYAGRLDDDQVALLATFIRGAWGNRADPVSSAAVRNVRNAH